MSLSSLILTNAAVNVVFMFVLWIISVVKKDASIVDPCWGVGFVLIAWSTVYQVGGLDARSGLLATLVTVWGLRLAIYLGWRNSGEGEDRRYTKMREKHGEQFWWLSLLTVFLLQGTLMWFISLTFQSGIYNSTTTEMSWIALFGIAIFGVSASSLNP